jgi:hypothetical protein
MNYEPILTVKITPMTTTESIKNISLPNPPTDDDNSCMICYDPLNQDSGCVTIKCGHKYCPGCFVQHMKIDNHCAMCRREIEMKKPENVEKRTLLIRDSSMRFLASNYISQWSQRLESSIYGRWRFSTSDIRILIREELQDHLPEIVNAISENAIDTSRDNSVGQTERSRFTNEGLSLINRQTDQIETYLLEAAVMNAHARTGGHWGVPWNPEGEEVALD